MPRPKKIAVVRHDRIKAMREKRKWSQEYTAKRARVDVGRYNRYEKGAKEPSLSTLYHLSIAFHCSIDYLLGLVDKKKALYREPALTPGERAMLRNFHTKSLEDFTLWALKKMRTPE